MVFGFIKRGYYKVLLEWMKDVQNDESVKNDLCENDEIAER